MPRTPNAFSSLVNAETFSLATSDGIKMLNWIDERTFEIDGCLFTIDISPGYHRRRSEAQHFTIVKNRPYIDRYLEIAQFRFNHVLELGVFQGGSFVFFDKLFQPNKIVGIELANKPVEPLDQYIAGRAGAAKLYYGISQDDEGALEEIVRQDLNGEIDLVVDDASHTYERTRASFVALFPKLKAGGLYIIEDWAWSFHGPYQDPAHPWHKQPAMVNLLFELIQEIALNNAISSMQIFGTMAIVRKSVGVTQSPPLVKSALRGRELPRI